MLSVTPTRATKNLLVYVGRYERILVGLFQNFEDSFGRSRYQFCRSTYRRRSIDRRLSDGLERKKLVLSGGIAKIYDTNANMFQTNNSTVGHLFGSCQTNTSSIQYFLSTRQISAPAVPDNRQYVPNFYLLERGPVRLSNLNALQR